MNKGEVRVVGLEQGRQTSKIGHVISVESEEGEERPLGLAIVSMSCHCHLGWNRRCVVKGAAPTKGSIAHLRLSAAGDSDWLGGLVLAPPPRDLTTDWWPLCAGTAASAVLDFMATGRAGHGRGRDNKVLWHHPLEGDGQSWGSEQDAGSTRRERVDGALTALREE